MTARNSRGQFTRKQTVSDIIDVDAKHVDDRYSDFESLFAEFGVLRYPLAGALTNVITSAFGIYGGIVTAAWIGLGALLLTGSGFISFLITIVTAFVLAIEALRFGAVAGKYVATGQFEDDYQRAKGWLASKLEGGKAYVAAKFSTLH